LIREKEGNLCIRYYQRVDGTVMTQDCPVGIAAVKRKITRAFATSIVVSVAMLSAFAQWWHGNNIFADRLSVWAERLHPTPPVEFNPHSPPSHTRLQPPPPPQTPEAIMGAPAVMGEMAPEPEAMLGRMRIEPSTQDR
ncbi:MAG: hypothetical protein H7145_02405, partial [Akkermansiaceae bacterium]|nr:hypothetical protein [Armatimonadota bacterium]